MPRAAFTPPRRVWVHALAALAVYLALRWPGMTQSLWLDEVFRTRVGLTGDSARHLILRDVHNPLYNLFMYAWIRVAGDGEVAVRLPSLIAGLVIVAAVWRWAHARFGPAAGTLAAWWLIVNPVHVWYSTEAKNNIVTVMFTTLAVIALERAMRTRTAGTIAASALACLAALATDFQSLLLLGPTWALTAWMALRTPCPGGLAWPAPEQGRARAALPLILTILAGCAFAIPWGVHKALHLAALHRSYLGYMHWHEGFRLLLVWLPTGSALPPVAGEAEEFWLWRGLLLAPLVVPPLVLGVRTLRKTPAGVLVLGGVLWPLVLLYLLNEVIVQSGFDSRIYQPRNLLVMLPWFGLTATVGLASAPAGRWRWVLIACTIGLGALSTTLIRTTEADRVTVITPNPDWRGVGAWLRAQDPPGEPLPVVCNALLHPLRYYVPGRPLEAIPRREPTLTEVSRAADARGWREFVFVADVQWWPAPTPADYAALHAHYDAVSRAEFRSLIALRLRVR
jgi:hypothetical protein